MLVAVGMAKGESTDPTWHSLDEGRDAVPKVSRLKGRITVEIFFIDSYLSLLPPHSVSVRAVWRIGIQQSAGSQMWRFAMRTQSSGKRLPWIVGTTRTTQPSDPSMEMNRMQPYDAYSPWPTVASTNTA